MSDCGYITAEANTGTFHLTAPASTAFMAFIIRQISYVKQLLDKHCHSFELQGPSSKIGGQLSKMVNDVALVGLGVDCCSLLLIEYCSVAQHRKMIRDVTVPPFGCRI